MPKRGDIRESDGFVFWNMERKSSNKAEFREKWLSPEYYALKKVAAVKSSIESVNKRKAADPVYAAKVREISRVNMAAYWLTRPKEMMVVRKRAFCKKYGLAFDLSAGDFEIPDICPLLGIPLERGKGIAKFNSPELDRIDPKGGYVKGNVWVISRRANMIKTNASIAEIRMVANNWPW